MNRRQTQRTFTGRHMLAVMVAFFGVVGAVNLGLAVLANTSWTGLVVENSYVASQAYNGVIQAAREQAERGWQDRFAATGEGLFLTLADADGEPLSGLEVDLVASRPTHAREDRRTRLAETAPGVYAAETRLAPGVWEAKVEAAGADGRVWRQVYRIVMRKAD